MARIIPNDATMQASLEATAQLFSLTLQTAQTLEAACTPSQKHLTLHGLWVCLTNHLATDCGWTPIDLSRGALKFAECAMRDRARRTRHPQFCVLDLQTGLYYDPATADFRSPEMVPIKRSAVPASFWSQRTYLLMDVRDVDCYDLDYARFERWLWSRPEFADEPFLTAKLINAAATLASTNWSGRPPSHVILIPTGRFRTFVRELTAVLGLDRRTVRHAGQGVVGIDDAETATLISLMGYHPVAYDEIQQRLNGAKFWLLAGHALAPA